MSVFHICLIAIAVLVACSAFFSAAEMAFSSANRIRLHSSGVNTPVSQKTSQNSANPSFAAWLSVLDSAQFYPTTKAEWADVKIGSINAEQQALIGGDVRELLDALQAQIAGE